MSLVGINFGGISSTALRVNKIQNQEISNSESNEQNNNLDSPMETVGRSMVNFKGVKQLSPDELNCLAKALSQNNITPEELSTLKAALIDTMKQYKVENLKELTNTVHLSLDDALDLGYNIADNMKKKSPNIDYDRAFNLANNVIYN